MKDQYLKSRWFNTGINLSMPINSLLQNGRVLIATSAVEDINLKKSVILVTSMVEGEVSGFILNKPTMLHLGDLIEGIYAPDLIVAQGGTEQLDCLHILHTDYSRYGGHYLAQGIYHGGSYERLLEAVKTNQYESKGLRLFVGGVFFRNYQLQKQVKEGRWIVSDLSQHEIMAYTGKDTWEYAIWQLGDNFKWIANMPEDAESN